MFYSNYGFISVVSEIFNVEECGDIEIGVTGQSNRERGKFYRLGVVSY